MEALARSPSQTRKQTRSYESRREREFYRYYEPIRALSGAGPPLCDLNDPAAARTHIPCSSPDRSLTAFCQLGALRLGTRRALLFFFDKNYAYVLAEATRTLSLQDDAIHDIEDQLWLGHTVIPRGHSVCEHTINLPSNQGSNAGDPMNAGTVHVVNDLREDTRFCDRAYVLDGPKARFYAGVPITTPKGINIGAYCVLDDKVRDGLDEKDTSFLKDMALTIMTHLTMVQGRAEQMRSARMFDGLSTFVEGASDQQSELEDCKTPARWKPFDVKHEADPLSIAQQTPTRRSTGKMPTNTDSRLSSVSTAAATPPTTSSAASEPLSAATVTRNAATLRERLVASNVQATFERAAQSISKALEVDGSMFLDATILRYGGLVDKEDRRGSSEHSASDSARRATDLTSTDNEEYSNRPNHEREEEMKSCTILSSSCVQSQDLDEHVNVRENNMRFNMTEKFLRSLLRRYRGGKIWNFNEDGHPSSDEESSGSTASRQNGSSGSQSPLKDQTNDARKRKRNTKRTRLDDAREVHRLLPGARSVMISGMWDQTRQRWLAACVVWSYSPFRLLSEGELHFLSAFNDVTLAEVHRLEAQNSDRRKADFISSISHELRSPLHGILGSVDYLEEELAPTAETGHFVSQIRTCGQTLLEIVEHLLDYSRINFFDNTGTTHAQNAETRQQMVRDGTSFGLGGVSSLDANVALDKITEEVVETAFTSFCYNQDKLARPKSNVTFILDIDRSSTTDWGCRIVTGGWKRICMNLVSNALKYTDDGYVRVSLSPAPSKSRKRLNAVLTVIDTGRGMSKDFVESHLFRAFSQEESFNDGTGLGMSLVAKIVKAFDGTIEVRSEKGVGTTVVVTVPLVRATRSQVAYSEGNHLSTQQPFEGNIVGIVNVNGSQAAPSAASLQTASLRKTCTELGLSFQIGSASDCEMVDVLIMSEGEARILRKMSVERERMPLNTEAPTYIFGSKPLIILCENIVSLQDARTSGITELTSGRIEFIAQPAGPEKLAKAIWQCVHDESEHLHRYPGAAPSDKTNLTKSAYAIDSVSTTSTLQANVPFRSNMLRRSRSESDPQISPRTEQQQNPPVAAQGETNSTDGISKTVVEVDGTPLSKATNGTPQAEDRMHGHIDDAVTATPNPGGTMNNNHHSGLPILLVDDNRINLQLLVTYAKKNHHRKTTASDGLQAVEAYKAAHHASVLPQRQVSLVQSPLEPVVALERPKVVLMDISMPVLDGFEATRQIRQFETEYSLPPATIIALTGLGSAEAQQEAYSSGIDLFLMKPVKFKELTAILDSIPRA